MNKFLTGTSNYDKKPVIEMASDRYVCYTGWAAIANHINKVLNTITKKQKIIVVECYHGVKDEDIIPHLQQLVQAEFYFAKDCLLPGNEIDKLVYPDVTDDEVFGYMTRLTMEHFFDPSKLKSIIEKIASNKNNIIIYGTGAYVIHSTPDLLIYVDMARWEIQLRFRRNEICNLGVNNKLLPAPLQYKRAFFVDWRVCDRLKKKLMPHWDLVIDSNQEIPKMVSGQTLRDAYIEVVQRPFRVVPFFDPGPWGGQWMKEYCDLDKTEKNYAWCFDCVPEENSLFIKIDNALFETPAINVVFYQPKKLLGEAVQARFGDEFPIRFDFLDTMDGGNLSLQVHPTTSYIQDKFGMHYTQDESYYIMDAADDACVYLGLKENVSATEMIVELQDAQEGGFFEATKFVEKWPVKKHDHVLIPAGTVHCSGANSMVLEISATPYIFTFKLWDWGRMGLDGKPRPINIQHGQEVIDWSRTSGWVKKELINVIEKIAEGDGWIEERTGLHKTEFIETRRHWFTKKVFQHTHGSVNVLNLVEGKEIIVESPSNAFEPFIVHYAETFIIPEVVKEYTVRPHGEGEGSRCGTIKAFLRT